MYPDRLFPRFLRNLLSPSSSRSHLNMEKSGIHIGERKDRIQLITSQHSHQHENLKSRTTPSETINFMQFVRAIVLPVHPQMPHLTCDNTQYWSTVLTSWVRSTRSLPGWHVFFLFTYFIFIFPSCAKHNL